MTNKIAIAIIALAVIAIIVPDAYAQQRDVAREAYLERCDNILNDRNAQWHEFGCTYFPEIWTNIADILDRLFNVEDSILTLSGNLTSVNATINERTDNLEVYAGKAMTKANKALDRLDNHNKKFMDMKSNITGLDNSVSLLNDTFKNTVIKVDDMSERLDEFENQLNQTKTKMDALDERLQIFEGRIPKPSIPLNMDLSTDDLHLDEQLVVSGYADPRIFATVSISIYNKDMGWFYHEQPKLNENRFYTITIIPDDTWVEGTYNIEAGHGGLGRVMDNFTYTAHHPTP